MINTLQLFAAQDFLDAYFRYDVKSQCQVRNALQDMAKRFTAAPARVWTQYQQYKRFGREAKDNGLSGIIEVEVAGSVRLLAGVSAPKLYLLDLGQHDIEQRWDGIKTKSKWVKNRLANSKPANNLLFKGSANPFIRFSECKGWYKQYAAEDTSEWVVFLDRKQTEIVTSIIGEIKDHLHKNTWRDGLWLILGGPGTGKTVVLLKILQELLVETFSVGFSCSDAVYHYLKSATGCNIPRWNRESDSAHDVLLFDDPKDLEELANPPPRRPGQRARALVYAFDPLQLSRMPKSSELDGVIKRTKANEYELSICYRQREEIAKPVVNMTNVLAESNAYLEKNKVENFETDYSDLLRRFNNPEFQYHLGECKEYDAGAIGSLRLLPYLTRITKSLPDVVRSLSVFISSPEIKIGCPDATKFDIVSNIIGRKIKELYPQAKYVEIDGVRMDTDEEMLIVRASQNGPYLTVKFEGKTQAQYDNVKKQVSKLLHEIPDIDFNSGVNAKALE